MNRNRRSDGLEPEDRALWNEVTKSVAPLRPVSMTTPPTPSQRKPANRPAPPRPAAMPKAPVPLAKLERRARQRIARGSIAIDAKLDLHGHTLERARLRLEAFLARAQARGAAVVLVITGKGGRGGEEGAYGERGALRRQVPFWLALPEFRPLVIAFEEAAPAHGGAGALYVRVRRRRA